MESAEHLAVKTWAAERLRAANGSCPLSFRHLGREAGSGLLQWEPQGQLKGIWTEDPIDAGGKLISVDWSEVEIRGEFPHTQQPPDREAFKSLIGRYPAVIFDVSVRSRGRLIAAIEIEHTSANSREKLEFCKYHGIRLYSLRVDHFAANFARSHGLQVRDDFVSRW
jgi:hypothetical protein